MDSTEVDVNWCSLHSTPVSGLIHLFCDGQNHPDRCRDFDHHDDRSDLLFRDVHSIGISAVMSLQTISADFHFACDHHCRSSKSQPDLLRSIECRFLVEETIECRCSSSSTDRTTRSKRWTLQTSEHWSPRSQFRRVGQLRTVRSSRFHWIRSSTSQIVRQSLSPSASIWKIYFVLVSTSDWFGCGDVSWIRSTKSFRRHSDDCRTGKNSSSKTDRSLLMRFWSSVSRVEREREKSTHIDDERSQLELFF